MEEAHSWRQGTAVVVGGDDRDVLADGQALQRLQRRQIQHVGVTAAGGQ